MGHSGTSAQKQGIELDNSMDKPEAESADMAVDVRASNRTRLEETLAQIRNRENIRKQNQKRHQEDDYAKLEALKQNLKNVIAQIPEDNKSFDFTVSRSAHPKLQIDAAAFVTLRPGGEGYLLYLDGSGERKILAEAKDRDGISATIVRYVASRLAHQKRTAQKRKEVPVSEPVRISPELAAQLTQIMDKSGDEEDFIDTTDLVDPSEDQQVFQSKYFGEKPLQKRVQVNQAALDTSTQHLTKRKSGRAMRSFLYFVLGILVGAGGLLAVAWFRLELGL